MEKVEEFMRMRERLPPGPRPMEAVLEESDPPRVRSGMAVWFD